MQNPAGIGQADSEALARARYAVYAQRRTMPPRCNPIGILLLVLALGVLFIGLTMTVIANWPGATSIGENPLRVAGPVLLGCGGFFFILIMILIALLNRAEQAKWERRLTNLAADRINNTSREILVVNQNQPPVFGVEPYKNRSSSGQGDQEVTSSRGSGAYPVKGRYNVDMMPDPDRRGGNQSGKLHDISLDSEEKVPDPMRVQKKRPTSRKSGSSNPSINNSYSSGAGEADLGVPSYLIPSGQRLSQQASSSNGGYTNTSFESPDKEPQERPGAKNGAQQQRNRTAKGERARRGQTPGASNQFGGEVGRVLDPQQLRVHIRAQPGTAVHITPSATPTSSRHSYQAAGRTSLNTSGETEI